VFHHFNPNADEGCHELENVDIDEALPGFGQSPAPDPTGGSVSTEAM
jgi:hypothetical protein